jgi:hypothetical protein
MNRAITTAAALLMSAVTIGAQAPQAPPSPAPPPPAPAGRGLLGRPSPPQPQQQRSLDYFIGRWHFEWTGRETPLTPGPRRGQATISRGAAPSSASIAIEGTVDEGAAYKETGSLQWDDATSTITVSDHLAGGAEVKGATAWTSPIAFKVESAPMQVKGQTLKVRRTYSILSPTSFSITEELSTNGGAYQRVGTGDFRKQQ